MALSPPTSPRLMSDRQRNVVPGDFSSPVVFRKEGINADNNISLSGKPIISSIPFAEHNGLDDTYDQTGISVNNARHAALAKFDLPVIKTEKYVFPARIKVDGLSKPMWYIGDVDRCNTKHENPSIPNSNNAKTNQHKGLMTVQFLEFHQPSNISCSLDGNNSKIDSITYNQSPPLKGSPSTSPPELLNVIKHGVDHYRSSIYSYKLTWDNSGKICKKAEVDRIYKPTGILYNYITEVVGGKCASNIISPSIEGTIIKIFKFADEVKYSTSTYINYAYCSQLLSPDYKALYDKLGGPSEDELFGKLRDSSFVYSFKIVHASTGQMSKTPYVDHIQYMGVEKLDNISALDSNLKTPVIKFKVDKVSLSDLLDTTRSFKNCVQLVLSETENNVIKTIMDVNPAIYDIYYGIAQYEYGIPYITFQMLDHLYGPSPDNPNESILYEYYGHWNNEQNHIIIPKEPLDIKSLPQIRTIPGRQLNDYELLFHNIDRYNKNGTDYGAITRELIQYNYDITVSIYEDEHGVTKRTVPFYRSSFYIGKTNSELIKFLGPDYEMMATVRGHSQNAMNGLMDLIMLSSLGRNTYQLETTNNRNRYVAVLTELIYNGYVGTHIKNYAIPVQKFKEIDLTISGIMKFSDMANFYLDCINFTRRPAIIKYINILLYAFDKFFNFSREVVNKLKDTASISIEGVTSSILELLKEIGLSDLEAKGDAITRPYSVKSLGKHKTIKITGRKIPAPWLYEDYKPNETLQSLEVYLDSKFDASRTKKTKKSTYLSLQVDDLLILSRNFDEYYKLMHDKISNFVLHDGTFIIDEKIIRYDKVEYKNADYVVSYFNSLIYEYSDAQNYVLHHRFDENWRHATPDIAAAYNNAESLVQEQGQHYKKLMRSIKAVMSFFAGFPIM